MNRPLCIPHCGGVGARAKKALNPARRNSNRSRPNIPLGYCMTSIYRFSQSTLPDTSDLFELGHAPDVSDDGDVLARRHINPGGEHLAGGDDDWRDRLHVFEPSEMPFTDVAFIRDD